MDRATATSSEELRLALGRARRCVMGHLCPMVLHETNNVLTVLAGIRQILSMGKALPDRLGPMIDGQLDKMEALLGWMRQVNPEDGDGRGTGLEPFCTSIQSLIGLAGKGRKLELRARVARDGQTTQGPLEALGLAILCTVLPLMPPRAHRDPVHVSLELGLDESSVWCQGVMEPVPEQAEKDPDVRLAIDVAGAARGESTLERHAGNELSFRYHLPASR